MCFPISIKNISYSYQVKGFEPIVAIKNIDLLEIKKGQILFFIGPNGSGKSTLLNVLLKQIPEKFNLKISYVPQNPYNGIVPDITINENLLLRKIITEKKQYSLKKLLTPENVELVNDIIREFGLNDTINDERFGFPPDALSGGQQQLINLISVIISNPDIIILDEPTSKLDEINKIKFYNLLLEAVKKTNATILCASHDLDYTYRTADRIVKLENGGIVDDFILRFPFSERFIGEIRYIKNIENFPYKFNPEDLEWWTPGKDKLFPKPYIIGDNSVEGYLNKYKLNRDKRTNREVNGLINLLGIENINSKILDAPCGWGRHSTELAKKGYNVTGIDLCDEYIKIAKDRALELNLSINYFCRNLLNNELPSNEFDFIFNMWTSFGFFDEKNNEKVLSEYIRILKPGGRILIHSDLNPLRVSKGIFDEPNIRTLEDGMDLAVNEYYNSSDSFVYGNWSVLKDGKVEFSNNYRIRVYSELEWKSFANKFDITLINVYGSFDDSNKTLSPSSQEFIVVLEK